MTDLIESALAELGEDRSNLLSDVLNGRLQLYGQQAGQGGGETLRLFESFTVEIVRYLSNWEFIGFCGPAQTSFSMTLDDQRNVLDLGVGSLFWSIPLPGNPTDPVRVINSYQDGELLIRFRESIFSAQDPAWRISNVSFFYARVGV